MIYARNYDLNGVPRADQFLVSTLPNTTNSNPFIFMDPLGYSLITWNMYDQVGKKTNTFAQRYLPAGITVQALTDGVVVNNLAGAVGSWQYFKITVPAGKAALDVVMTGPPVGDADLYLRYGALPALSVWDARPFLVGNNEGIRVLNPPAGDYYIGINGFDSFSSVSLQAATSQ